MYWIAHTGTDTVHYGWTPSIAHVSTGQAELESFPEQPEFIARLAELGINLSIEGPPTNDPREQDWVVHDVAR